MLGETIFALLLARRQLPTLTPKMEKRKTLFTCRRTEATMRARFTKDADNEWENAYRRVTGIFSNSRNQPRCVRESIVHRSTHTHTHTPIGPPRGARRGVFRAHLKRRSESESSKCFAKSISINFLQMLFVRACIPSSLSGHRRNARACGRRK